MDNVQPGGTNPSTKKCPFCAEEIKAEAIKCRYCGSNLVEKQTGCAVGPRGDGQGSTHRSYAPVLLRLGGIAIFVSFLLFLLLFVILPALARTRETAIKMSCATCLSGIYKAVLLYANDYQGELPRSGGPTTRWGSVADWMDPRRIQAFGLDAQGNGGKASVSSCLYLLVKYTEVTPKAFVCRGDAGTTEFKLQDKVLSSGLELVDVWDFGPAWEAYRHCSYSYHMPFGPYAGTMKRATGFVIAGDRNPWIDSPSSPARDFSKFKPHVPPFGGTESQARWGNSTSHRDTQNVVLVDGHVEYAKYSYCGLEFDNIYTVSRQQAGGDPLGTPPSLGSQPANSTDSLLVNDPPPHLSTAFGK